MQVHVDKGRKDGDKIMFTGESNEVAGLCVCVCVCVL